MRDILEDAEGAAERGDVGPGKANRERDKQSFPKRFYKQAEVTPLDTGFTVELDGKGIKTPGRKPIIVPTENAAQLMADEWNAIETEINPLLMPATRLVNTAVDGVADEMQAVMEDVTRYAASDMLCYRADMPKELVEKQREHWDPVLDWVLETFHAHFEITSGIMSVAQPKDTITAFGNQLKQHADPIKIACIHTFTSISGSALLALALAENHLTAETCWQAAHVDEDWNISRWGEDYEAAERRKQCWKDFEAADRLFKTI